MTISSDIIYGHLDRDNDVFPSLFLHFLALPYGKMNRACKNRSINYEC